MRACTSLHGLRAILMVCVEVGGIYVLQQFFSGISWGQPAGGGRIRFNLNLRFRGKQQSGGSSERTCQLCQCAPLLHRTVESNVLCALCFLALSLPLSRTLWLPPSPLLVLLLGAAAAFTAARCGSAAPTSGGCRPGAGCRKLCSGARVHRRSKCAAAARQGLRRCRHRAHRSRRTESAAARAPRTAAAAVAEGPLSAADRLHQQQQGRPL